MQSNYVAFVLIDCGRATRTTRGVTNAPFYEVSNPPANRSFVPR